MDSITIFPIGDSPAVECAARYLASEGIATDEENATHLLFNTPTKPVDLGWISPNTTVIGGNLDWLPPVFPRLDLLRDEKYVAENAHLTADCAVRLLGQHLPCAFRACPVLIIGWGRIGKCLAAMLKTLDARVSVAARKSTDLAMLSALGFDGVSEIRPEQYRAIINTAPAPVLGAGDGLRIDLASQKGIAGENVIWARGLPGKMLPESSGKLIAEAIVRHLREEEK
ncbi:MAG: hypothetical protein E7447_00445 [Ruminococcaceae bacterium]|nr:hypothetical protein [Oscillospiraceae bacterium]